jgi:hypothetical protein
MVISELKWAQVGVNFFRAMRIPSAARNVEHGDITSAFEDGETRGCAYEAGAFRVVDHWEELLVLMLTAVLRLDGHNSDVRMLCCGYAQPEHCPVEGGHLRRTIDIL